MLRSAAWGVKVQLDLHETSSHEIKQELKKVLKN